MSRPTLAALTDHDHLFRQLTDAGMSATASRQKVPMFSRSAQALIQAGKASDTPAIAWFVPGRIEWFGKHTDYAGGRSLTAAVERGFCAVATARDDKDLLIFEVAGERSVQFPISPDLTPTPGHWSNYPMTVARRVAKNFSGPHLGGQGNGENGSLRGASVAFMSDLPLASGMSSSSALVITLLLLLRDVNHWEDHPTYRESIHSKLDLASYAATIENGQSFACLAGDQGVGTFGGSEDHTAILHSVPGEFGQYSYSPVRKERSIALPQGYVLAIASSGVVAEKTGSAMAKYNLASLSAAAVARVWRDATGRDDPHMASIVASTGSTGDCAQTLASIRGLIHQHPHPDFSPEFLTTRWDHFFAESEQIIPSIPDQLGSSELVSLGKLAERSQRLAATHLGNQVPETIFLAQTALKEGAVAASAFGAGFGGSVWALIDQNHVTGFMDAWEAGYQTAHPAPARTASFFATGAGPSAFPLTGKSSQSKCG